MNWIPLTQETQLQEIEELSRQQPVIVFKHSTRCSISATALSRLERNWKDTEMADVKPYYLDLLSYRPISGQITRTFEVEHQSPQLLLIRDGKCVYDASHFDINYDYLKKELSKANR